MRHTSISISSSDIQTIHLPSFWRNDKLWIIGERNTLKYFLQQEKITSRLDLYSVFTTQISCSICISYFRQMNVKFVRQRPFYHRNTMRKSLFNQVINLIRLFIAQDLLNRFFQPLRSSKIHSTNGKDSNDIFLIH